MENTECTSNATMSLTDLRKTPSRFEGSVIAFIGITLLTNFLTGISLGFAFPAMYCFKKRWIYLNTVVNGYRLRFTGTGGQLFGKYLLWMLLTLLTCGVFALWLPVKYQQWETKHIEIDSYVGEE